MKSVSYKNAHQSHKILFQNHWADITAGRPLVHEAIKGNGHRGGGGYCILGTANVRRSPFLFCLIKSYFKTTGQISLLEDHLSTRLLKVTVIEAAGATVSWAQQM